MSDAQRLIRGCDVVTPRGVVRADILMQGEWIVAVAPGLSAPDVVEAGGLLAFPGAVDAHVHMREPGAEHKEDLTSGTRAALAGGVTTVLDMPNSPVATTSAAAWQAKLALAERKCCCDFGLFIGATPANAAEVAAVTGAAGLKVYMGSSTGDLLVSDLGAQLEHFATYPAERVLAVHAEDEEAVRLFAGSERRPPLCAELSVARAVALARRTHRRLHVCHVSTAAELELLALAKRQGLAVTVEVAPHHLFLSQADEARLGPLGVMNPPLRSPGDVDALWRGLAGVDVMASDHAPHTLAEKQSARPPSGVPGVETMLPLLVDAALGDRLSLVRAAELLAAGPAAAFALPHKGRIAAGYHADIVLIDPSAGSVVGERLHTRCGWSPYTGRSLRGRVERVLLRGRDAAIAGDVVAEPGWGKSATGAPLVPDALTIALAAATLFVAALTQGVTGFGFGLVAMAVLPLFYPARDASVLIGAFSLLSCAAVFWSVRSSFNWHDMVYPLVGMVAGVPLGVYALTVLNEQAIRKLVAIVVMLAALQTAAPRLGLRRSSVHPLWGALAGLVGGVLGGAFGIGGPPVIVYASVLNWPASRYKAMLTSYFTCSNVYRVVLLAAAGLFTRPILMLGAWVLPAALLGTFTGIRLYTRLSADTFRKVVVVTLVLLALTLLIS